MDGQGSEMETVLKIIVPSQEHQMQLGVASVIPALRRLRCEDCQTLETTLGYIEGSRSSLAK